MDAYVVGIATAWGREKKCQLEKEEGLSERQRHAREVRHGEKGILVKDIALEEPLQQVPRHWLRRRQGGGWAVRTRKRKRCDGGGRQASMLRSC